MGSAELSDERKEASAKGAREQAAHSPEGAKIAVACSPAQGIENTLLLGEELLERGFRIVPHISARLVTDRAHLEEIGRRLYDLDVREVFVIGRDVGKPAGPDIHVEILSAAVFSTGSDEPRTGRETTG
jgi:methylenetetrahydrofolate reductase (NADPH)